jgi:hypothetical protein
VSHFIYVLVFYLVFGVVRPALAEHVGWTYEMQISSDICAVKVSSGSDRHGIIGEKMTEVIKAFTAKSCDVKTISGDIEIEPSKAPVVTSVDMFVKYACKTPADNERAVYRTEEEGNEHYRYDCRGELFKFYANGFDRYNDGKSMHWDSQGTSRELPWAPILTNNIDGSRNHFRCFAADPNLRVHRSRGSQALADRFLALSDTKVSPAMAVILPVANLNSSGTVASLGVCLAPQLVPAMKTAELRGFCLRSWVEAAGHPQTCDSPHQVAGRWLPQPSR